MENLALLIVLLQKKVVSMKKYIFERINDSEEIAVLKQ